MIPIKKEDEGPGGPWERCCICRKQTAYWTDLPDRSEGEQVACCRACSVATADLIPTKRIWCMRERVATGDHADSTLPQALRRRIPDENPPNSKK